MKSRLFSPKEAFVLSTDILSQYQQFTNHLQKNHSGCPQCGLPPTDKNKRKTKGCCRRKEVEAQACPDSLTSSKCIFYEDDADDDHAIVDTDCQRLNPEPIVIFQLSVDCQLRPPPAG